MESLSFESTIESPTKPHQEKAPDENNKSLFLVQVISDNKLSEQKSQNLEINENKENNEIKKSSPNILNFDDILSIVFPVKNQKKSEKKKSEKKLLGNKKKRQVKTNINKSKNNFIIR